LKFFVVLFFQSLAKNIPSSKLLNMNTVLYDHLFSETFVKLENIWQLYLFGRIMCKLTMKKQNNCFLYHVIRYVRLWNVITVIVFE